MIPNRARRKNTQNPFLIFNEFLRNAKQIGSVVPDSPDCTKKLLKHIPWSRTRTVVEWGGGSGTVTRAVLSRLPSTGRLITFDLNPRCLEHLSRIQDPRLSLVNSDFTRLRSQLDVLGIDKVDAIVSTLPSSQIPGFCRKAAELAAENLSSHGVFVQYMHVTASLLGYNLERELKKCFTEVIADVAILNLPPSIVCSCKHPRVHRLATTPRT